MARKVVLVLSTLALLSVFLVTVQVEGALAVTNPTNFPGTVKCSPAGGVWNGVIRFSPALKNGGTSSNETFTVKAGLGNSASPCITTAGFVALGAITGSLKFHIVGSANNCATIFSGIALPAPTAGSLKMTWSSPSGGNPTNWTMSPAFKVTGALSEANIVVKKAKVTGSFTPFANPKASLSDANWPGSSGAVATGCASATGLSSLTLSTSIGKW